jgi:hypothetical protein
VSQTKFKVAPSSDDILAAVSESFNAVSGDLLTILGTAALALPNATTSTISVGEVCAVQTGSTNYIVTLLAANLLLLLSIIVATIVSGIWSPRPVFDYTDRACMSAGLAADAAKSQLPDTVFTGVLEHWNGDPTDRVLGQLGVHIDFATTPNRLSVA